MNYYKNFLITFISLCALIILFIMISNYFIDPGNQFYHAKRIENVMIAQLLNNKPVMVKTNYNDRLLQKMMLIAMKKQPETLILGSSHSLPITQEAINTPSFYNASVSGGHLEDDIALYYLYEKKGWQAKQVIICLDPWLINKKFTTLLGGDGIQLWKANLSTEYNQAKRAIFNENHLSNWNSSYEKITGGLEKYSQLLTLDFIKSSIKKIKVSVTKQPPEVSSTLDCPSCYIKWPNGALSPSKNDELLSAQQVDLLTIDMMSLISMFYQDFSTIDADHASIFEHFIQYLLKKHVQIIFYFPPFEPLAYKELFEKNNNYHTLMEVERYYYSLALKYNIQTVGSYNPTILGLEANDFIDSWHLKNAGVKKVFYQYPNLINKSH